MTPLRLVDPRVPPDPLGPALVEWTEPATEPVNILLVDDQPENLMALQAILEGLGQNLITAMSGREALRVLLNTDVAVILLDVKMPDMDGLETAALIRERERSRHTPIIFLTAAEMSEASIFRGYALGAVDYIIKPIVPDFVRSKVSVFVEMAKKTAQLERQAALLRQSEQAARELAESRARLLADLQQKNRELESFSYSVSHDLRAPLRSIDGFSLALLEDHGDQLDERARECLERVRAATRQMGQLIDDILTLARVSRAEMVLEPVDLSAMAAAIMARLRDGEPERQVEFVLEPGLSVTGDPRLLQVALENLLGNAWKFTSKRPSARIEFGCRNGEDGRPVFFVRDDGAGFDMQYAGKLFGPFQRLHSASDFPGTGVGLATVQRIIERHGGRVWADAEVNRGAVFHFTI